MWVHSPDTDTGRLWIVPDAAVTDQKQFCRIVAETISSNEASIAGLDVGSVEFVAANHPAMQGMGRFIKQKGIGQSQFSGNRFNGFYLPDGIVIRMDL